MNHSRLKRVLFFIFIALLILILRLPSLEEPFDNDSSAVAYSARLITRGEPLYSTHHPGHHMPGAYYTYALAFDLLGDRTSSVKIILIPWLIATAYVVYELGRALQDDRTGMFSAVIFSILSSHMYLKGTTAEPEMFAMLPYTATVLLAVKNIQNGANGRYFILSGILGSIAFLYKAVFLAPLAVSAGMILLQMVLELKSPSAVLLGVRRAVGLFIGCIFTLALVLVYFSFIGLIDRFLLVFTLGESYSQLTNNQSVINIFLIPIYILAINNFFLIIFGFAGAFRLAIRMKTASKSDSVIKIIGAGLLVWFWLSILTAGFTRVDYPHYSLIVVPSLALFSGYELSNLIQKIFIEGQIKKKKAGPVLLASVLVLTLLNSVLTNVPLYRHFIKYRLSKETYDQFIEKGTYEGWIYQREKELANYIVLHTEPGDRIYHWTDFPQIYYLADRQAPIDMIWPTQAELTGSYKRIFAPQTKYIIVGTSLYIPEPSWMHEELSKSYQLETIIDNQKVYHRVGD